MVEHIVIEHIVIQHSLKEFLSARPAAASWLANTVLKTQWYACFSLPIVLSTANLTDCSKTACRNASNQGVDIHDFVAVTAASLP